ncbi:MAG: S-layer family protein [Calothrix sp. SM1_7_51]|nr:S-layer family protein [Calothrix sp. SM1_7_51]
MVDLGRLINKILCASAASSFVITGRGGLPPSPNAVLENEAVWEDLRLNPVLEQQALTTNKNPQENTFVNKSKDTLVEAQGWIINSQGQVELVASSTHPTPHPIPDNPWYQPLQCN